LNGPPDISTIYYGFEIEETTSMRNHADEIIEIKKRNMGNRGILLYYLSNLSAKWRETSQDNSSTPDFYLIRAVTILEVSARQEMSSLIDHAKQFTDRAIVLTKSIKLDFSTVQNVQGRAITLGDIVAHSVSVNSFNQIIDYFETLLAKPLRPLLMNVVDRWSTEIEGKPSKPIISDYDSLNKRLNRLFIIRHILCHEMPDKSVYSTNEVAGFLDDAFKFSKALEEILNFEKFGLTPLTQTEMNIAAGERLKNAQTDLDCLLLKILEYLSNSDSEHTDYLPSEISLLSSLNEAQDKWDAYRKTDCNFIADMYRGGSIMPLIWANRATEMTVSRTKELQTWFDRESNH
jgi:uncharacterized protein YecT (DUF1311 family)